MSPNPESLYLSFEYSFDASDRTSIEEYRRTLEDFRNKALEKPLNPSTIFSLNLRLKSKPSANSRPIPQFASKLIPEEGRSYSCQLLQPLYDGLDRHSQIWVAQVLDNGEQYASDPGVTTFESSKIILKIFQQSLSNLPTVEGIKDNDGTYAILEEHAKNEELAYTILTDLQGTYVPYCYGLHEITTPSGEQAWALALEYINGVNIQQIGQSCKLKKGEQLDLVKLKNLCETYRSATKAIRAVQDLEVHHLVKKANNYIAIPGSNFVVVIDFAITEFSMNPLNRVGGMLWACQSILDSFDDYQDAVQTWVDEHLDMEFRGYVDLPDEYFDYVPDEYKDGYSG